MLSCKDTVRSASDYLDGKLRWQHRLQLNIHLVMCVLCRRFIKQFKLADATAAAAAQRPASDHDVAAVMDQINRQS